MFAYLAGNRKSIDPGTIGKIRARIEDGRIGIAPVATRGMAGEIDRTVTLRTTERCNIEAATVKNGALTRARSLPQTWEWMKAGS